MNVNGIEIGVGKVVKVSLYDEPHINVRHPKAIIHYFSESQFEIRALLVRIAVNFKDATCKRERARERESERNRGRKYNGLVSMSRNKPS